MIDPDQQDKDDYPSKRCVLPPGDLQALQHAYTALNNGQLWATQLDSFGYISRDNMNWGGFTEDICPSEEDLMIARAKAAVLKFTDFTYVTDATLLEVEFSEGFMSDSGQCDGQEDLIYRGWTVVFGNQVYEQLEILKTSIEVGQNSEGVYWIGRHWYPDITVPDCDSVSFDEAKEMIVGTEISWYDFSGEPHVFTVGENSFADMEEKVVLPVRISDCIELRVTWRIGIRFLPTDQPSWYIYVDTTTGETVRTEQLFVT